MLDGGVEVALTCKMMMLISCVHCAGRKSCVKEAVTLLGCRIAETPLNLFIRSINGRLVCPSIGK